MRTSVVAQCDPAREARILEVNGPPAVAVDDHSGCLFNKEAAAGVDYQREVKGRHAAGANEGVVCLASHRLLAGVSPVVVSARAPRRRRPVLLGDRGC